MKLLLTRIPLVALLCLAPALALGAGGGLRSELFTGGGARALSLGGAFASLAGGAEAVFWNPAGLTALERHGLYASHSRYFEGTEASSLSWAGEFDRVGAFGASFHGLATDKFAEVSDWTPTGSEIGFSTSLTSLAYAREFGERFSAGVAVRALYEKVAGVDDFGFGADLGLRAVFGSVVAAAAGRNVLAPSLALGADAETLRREAQIGVGVAELTPAEQVSVSAGVEALLVEDRDPALRAGAEVTIAERLALRGGYGDGDPAFGVGIIAGPVRFDYALVFEDDIRNTHHFGAALSFGPTAAERAERRAERRREIGESFARSAAAGAAQRALERARSFAGAQELDSALAQYRLAQELDGSLAVSAEVAEISTALAERRSRELAAALAEQQPADTATTLAVALKAARALVAGDAYGQALALLSVDTAAESRRAREEIAAARESWRAQTAGAAEAARRGGDFEGALRLYAELLREFPDETSFQRSVRSALDGAGRRDLLGRARSELALGNAQKSLTLAEALLVLDSANAGAVRVRDSALQALDEPGGLEQLARSPADWEAFSEALRLARSGEVDAAAELIDQLLEKYPRNSELLRNKRQLELRRGGK